MPKLLLAIACSCEQLRKKVGQPPKHATIKDITIANPNYCVRRHPNCQMKISQNERSHLENESLQTIASNKEMYLRIFSKQCCTRERGGQLHCARRRTLQWFLCSALELWHLTSRWQHHVQADTPWAITQKRHNEDWNTHMSS